MGKKVHSVEELLEGVGDILALKIINEVQSGPIPITVKDIHRPGLALAGFVQNYLHERIQILGETELLYINTRTPQERRKAVEQLFVMPLVCIIITRSLEPAKELVDCTREYGVPLLQTSMLTTPFIHELTKYLDDVFAPVKTIHATLVDVYGVGLLFTGRSGIGKSEIALDLVERGHRMVADDTVMVKRTADDVLIGRGHGHLKHFMEIRGLGIINVQDLFGIRSIRIQKRIEVEVNLRDWDQNKEWEREGLTDQFSNILGVDVPQVIVPIFSGKNITVISEVIAMNHMLKVYGIDAAKRFNHMLIDQMQSDRQTRYYLRYDTE
ncbi:MAG: HPr(Ser) kinase/phosphatase [Candidatus Latescibacterota bacterium]